MNIFQDFTTKHMIYHAFEGFHFKIVLRLHLPWYVWKQKFSHSENTNPRRTSCENENINNEKQKKNNIQSGEIPLMKIYVHSRKIHSSFLSSFQILKLYSQFNCYSSLKSDPGELHKNLSKHDRMSLRGERRVKQSRISSALIPTNKNVFLWSSYECKTMKDLIGRKCSGFIRV